MVQLRAKHSGDTCCYWAGETPTSIDFDITKSTMLVSLAHEIGHVYLGIPYSISRDSIEFILKVEFGAWLYAKTRVSHEDWTKARPEILRMFTTYLALEPMNTQLRIQFLGYCERLEL